MIHTRTESDGEMKCPMCDAEAISEFTAPIGEFEPVHSGPQLTNKEQRPMKCLGPEAHRWCDVRINQEAK